MICRKRLLLTAFSIAITLSNGSRMATGNKNKLPRLSELSTPRDWVYI
jgi:hypothetical protein